MNKTNTTETTLNNIRSMCAERDCREQSILETNRLERAKRDEAEWERMQNSNSILNSYIEKAKARENQQSQERNQSIQNLHDESDRRKAESDIRTKEMSSVIHRAMSNAYDSERNAADDYLNRHKEFLDKGREAVKREQSKTYFS